jgi:hypothetical protein
VDDSLCDEGMTAALLRAGVAAGCWGVSLGRAGAGCLALSRLLVGWPCCCVRGGAC